MTRGRRRAARYAVLAAIVTWLPIVILSIAAPSEPSGAALLRDQIAAAVRCLVCVPLFVLANELCMPRLWRIIDIFSRSGIVGDRERFDRAAARARYSMDSTFGKVVAVIAAYIASAAVGLAFPMERLADWHVNSSAALGFSPAGWWHVLVSLPVLFALAFHWMWRIAAWGMLLCRIARCDLHLVAAHPDGNGGIAFVGRSVGAFVSVGLGFSAIAAGRSAQVIAEAGRLTMSQTYFDVGYVVVIIALFVAPLLVFTPALVLTGRRGSVMYGSFARRMGAAFEQKWLIDESRPIEDRVFGVTDFSAMTDLYSITLNARKVHVVPVSRRDLMSLAVGLVIPFLPVVFLVVPAATILKQVVGLLF